VEAIGFALQAVVILLSPAAIDPRRQPEMERSAPGAVGRTHGTVDGLCVSTAGQAAVCHSFMACWQDLFRWILLSTYCTQSIEIRWCLPPAAGSSLVSRMRSAPSM